VYNLYYRDWPQRIIIDRGPVLTSNNPGNFELMQKHFKHGFKCIVLLRDLMDVFASYMKWYTENPDSFVNKLGKTDKEKLSKLMNEDGAIVKEIKSIQNAYNYPNMCHFIRYNDMVADPEKIFKELYKFLEEPYYPHKFQNLKQININDIEYDDTVVGKNMHTIKPTVRKQANNYIVPKSIREKYGHIKI
jgi:sulfotransferase